MRKEIIVNIFRNKDRNIDISLEAINNDIDKINIVKELVICNKDDNEMLGNTNNIEKYFFNYISKDKIENKIEILILKNINIDLSKSNIHFKSLKVLALKDSILFFPTKENICIFENLDDLMIKGDLDNILTNLNNLKNNNILSLIKQISLKIIPKTSKINIFKLINRLNIFIQEIKECKIYIKGILSSLDNNKTEKIDNNVFSKIKSFKLYSLNKLSKDSSKIIKDELIDKFNNLEELYLNENIECDLEDKKKLISIIDNCEEHNINFDLYNINNLQKIFLSICEYNKHKKALILYGEANMSFYNLNNKKLLLDIINNNHSKGELFLLSLCNFDMENIDYLNEILKKSINTVGKLVLKNLNINQEFIDILKSKNLFNCENLSIDNIIFNDEEVENNFYELINGYNNCKTLKLISLENINNYNKILSNEYLQNLSLDEIYEIDFNSLKNILLKRKNNLYKITFKNLELTEEQNKNDIIDIISHNKNNIVKLKIIGENFNFIFKEIQDKKIEFPNLKKLILHVDMENNDGENKDFISGDENKIKFLEKNKELINCIEKIDLQIINLSFENKEKLFEMYNNLKEIC